FAIGLFGCACQPIAPVLPNRQIQAATDGGGRSSDSLPGSRIFGGSLSATSDTPRIFLRCYTSPAASFSCEVYEMASSAFCDDDDSVCEKCATVRGTGVSARAGGTPRAAGTARRPARD